MSRNDIIHPEHIQEALTLAIKDQEGKYDECLVERLLLCVETGSEEVANIALQVIFELNNDEEFNDFNNSRLFRLQQAYCRNMVSCFGEDLEVTWLRCIWSKLPAVLARKDASEIKSLLPLLTAIVECRSSSKILEMKFESPTGSDTVIDVLTLVKTFLTDNKNYHIENAACNLFGALITQSIANDIVSSNQSSVLKLARDLIIDGCPAMYYVVQNIAQDSNIKLSREIFHYPLELRLHVAISSHKESEVNNICKCLGRLMHPVNDSGAAASLITKLKEALLFGPMLTFATYSMRPLAGHRPLLHLILYTILSFSRLEGFEESIKQQEQQLNVSKKDMDFVERIAKDKHLLPCLEYLEKSFNSQEAVALVGENNSSDEERLAFSVILQYIRANYNSPNGLFKNLLTSCMLLPKLIHHYGEEPPATREWRDRFEWLSKQMNLIFSEFIEPFPDNTSSIRKTIMIELISVLDEFYVWLPFEPKEKLNRRDHLEVRIIAFASNITDPDVLLGLAQILNSAIFIFDYHSRHYIDITYNHMRKIALEENHRPLIHEVIRLLARIDFQCTDDDITQSGLTRFLTIPSFFSDILNEPTMDDGSIETIALELSSADDYIFSKEIPEPCDRYIVFICKYTTYSCIELIIEGICKALRRDIAQKFQLDMLNLLEAILNSYKFEQQSPEGIDGVLKTLYRIHTDDEYGQIIRSRACEVVQSTKRHLRNVNFNSEEDVVLLNFFRVHKTSECQVRNERSMPYLNNCLGIESYVDQIRNQHGSVHLECY